LCDREWDRKAAGDNLRPACIWPCKTVFYTIVRTVYGVKFEIRSEIGVG
jgi:hypothetical protein